MSGSRAVPLTAILSQKQEITEKTQMESESGKICRTSGFRWVRIRVKIVSQGESKPGKQRPAKGRKMAVNFHFPSFLLGFTVCP